MLYMRYCSEGFDVNQANVQTSHNSDNRPRFLGPEDPLLGTDVFQPPSQVREQLPVGPLVDLRGPAESEFRSWHTRTDVLTSHVNEASGLSRRATSKPPPPFPQAKQRPLPKASPTSLRNLEQIIGEAVRRVTRLPRELWDDEINEDARAFHGRGHDLFMQAIEIAQMNYRDPDHADQKIPRGGGLVEHRLREW